MSTRTTRTLVATLLAALPLLASSRADADNGVVDGNGEGFDTHLFRPAMDSKGFFTTNGSDILGKDDVSLGLILDYGNTLLRAKDVGQQTPALISHSFQGTLNFNYGLFNRAVIGLSAPIILMTGDAQQTPAAQPAVTGWSSTDVNPQTISSVALHGKVRITRVEYGPGLAVGVQVGVPTSDAAKSGGADPSLWYWPQVMFENRFGATGRFRVGLNAGYRGHTASSTQLPLAEGLFKDGSRVTYGGSASFRVFEPLDVVAETYGTMLLSDADSKQKLSNEVVGGLKVFVDRNSFLMLGAGPRYTPGFEAADFRAFLGFVFEPSIGDRDGDGIKDDEDKCPDDPEDRDGFQDEDGCPDPDNDNDGILDVDDRCPNEPEDRDGDEDEDGCPEGNDGDRDGDGILDSKDKCPDDPEDRDGFQDEDGCPDPDNDQDGIPDKKDACPNDPEDKDGFQDEDGCPDPDNDKDGILDKVDRCPNEPETFNGFEDEDGCPDKGNVIIQDNNIVILQKIKFKTNSAEILPESNPILDAVGTTIVHHPEFVLMEIAGHADERSSDEYNLRLTQDRVNSVMAALVQRGVDRSRLRSKGYGEYCPEDEGHNEAAWEKNRRVEFKIVKTKDGPTGVELGCPGAVGKGVRPDPVP
ncbi:MAG: OmpA family protein [Myxococcales bacterium]|nr:OmpA family protein [Myxococcales bacterium]